MNQLALFLLYVQKVYGSTIVRGVRDGRSYPVIPTTPVFLTLLDRKSVV